MKPSQTRIPKRLAFLLLPTFMLSGCAVVPYEPAYVSYPPQTYINGYSAYPAPYAYRPAPVYAGPPVYFNFSYRSGGHGRGRHW